MNLHLIENKRWWVFPLLIFIASRFVAIFYYVMGAIWVQVNTCGELACHAFDYWDFSATWDSWWYMITAEGGYPDPSTIKEDSNGVLDQSPWAFYPLWSSVLRMGHAIGLDYYHFGSVLAVALSGVAVLMGYRWLSLKYPESKYAYSFLFWVCLSPLTLVMHLNYPEAITFLLLVTALMLVDNKKFLWAAPVILAIGLARPIAGAFGLFFVIMAVLAWKADRKLVKKYIGMAAVSAVSFSLWPLYVAFRFGVWDAYLKVQESWLIYGGGTYFAFIRENPTEWLINLALILGAASIVLSALYKSNVPLILKAWSMAYLIFLMVTAHVAFNVLGYKWTTIEQGGTPYFNTSLLRYCFLLMIPMVPLQFIPKRGLKRKIVIGLILLASLLLTIPYVLVYSGHGFLFGYA